MLNWLVPVFVFEFLPLSLQLPPVVKVWAVCWARDGSPVFHRAMAVEANYPHQNHFILVPHPDIQPCDPSSLYLATSD